MAESWDYILRTVLARVRDPGATMHPRDMCVDLLTRLQRMYSNHLKLVTQDFTLSVQRYLLLYTLTEATGDDPAGAPQGMTVLKVLHDNRPLERLTLPILRALDSRWPRATGPRLEGYVQLGYSFLLLWPGLDTPSSVVVTATKVTQDLAQADLLASLDIPAQVTPKLGQLLELLLLLRQRDMLSVQTLMYELNPGMQRRLQERPDAAETATPA